MNTIA
jgi:hypothetical protein